MIGDTPPPAIKKILGALLVSVCDNVIYTLGCCYTATTHADVVRHCRGHYCDRDVRVSTTLPAERMGKTEK